MPKVNLDLNVTTLITWGAVGLGLWWIVKHLPSIKDLAPYAGGNAPPGAYNIDGTINTDPNNPGIQTPVTPGSSGWLEALAQGYSTGNGGL